MQDLRCEGASYVDVWRDCFVERKGHVQRSRVGECAWDVEGTDRKRGLEMKSL